MELIKPTSDGSYTLYSDRFNATYHSVHGAATETQIVFIEAGLNELIKHTNQVTILEMGFGSGLNCLITLNAIVNSSININYFGIEKFPPSSDALHEFKKHLKSEESQGSFSKIHECPWNEPTKLTNNFTLTKLEIDIQNLTSPPLYDLVYFDAFAPNVQPELWTAELFRKIFDLCKPGAILTTYCAKGQVKRNLISAGFLVEKLPGPPGKREMTRATKPAS